MTAHCLKLPRLSLSQQKWKKQLLFLVYHPISISEASNNRRAITSSHVPLLGQEIARDLKTSFKSQIRQRNWDWTWKTCRCENPENLQVFLKLNKGYFLYSRNWCEHAVKTYGSKSEKFFLSQFKWSFSQLWLNTETGGQHANACSTNYYCYSFIYFFVFVILLHAVELNHNPTARSDSSLF